MLRPDNRMRQATEKGLGHVLFQALPESTGIPGAISLAKQGYRRSRNDGKGVARSAGAAVGDFLVGEGAAWLLPATFKALHYSETFWEQMRFLPAIALDAVNLYATAHVFASTGFNSLATIAFKTFVANTAENALINGVGAAAGKLRRGRS